MRREFAVLAASRVLINQGQANSGSGRSPYLFDLAGPH